MIRDVIADVAPTDAYVAFGTMNPMRPNKPPEVPTDVEQTRSLCEWLQGQLGFAVGTAAAIRGSAAVTIVGGHAQIRHGPGGGVTDLDGFAAGVYNAGYKVYWRDLGPAPPIVGRRHSARF